MSEANEIKKSQAVYDGDRKFMDLQSRVQTLENLCYSAKEVLNLEEAANFLGIAKSTLYKMTHENRIPFYKPACKLIYFENGRPDEGSWTSGTGVQDGGFLHNGSLQE